MMEKDRKKELRRQYAERRPEKGIACWQSPAGIWYTVTRDLRADFNSTSFQLKLGSWPEKELQRAYSADPASFSWSLAKELRYEDPAEDDSEDLELLLMEFLQEHPEAKPMKPRMKRP